MAAIALLLATWACMANAQKTPPPPPITTCAKLAKTLGVVATNNTLFCPTDAAFAELANDLGVAPAARGASSEAALLALAAANLAVFKSVLSFHIVPGVLPASKFKDGAALATVLPKAGLRLLSDGTGWDVAHEGPEHTEHTHAAAGEGPKSEAVEDSKLLPGEHADEVVATDVTFEGRFDPKTSKYVVHVLSGVMVPPAAEAALEKIKAAAAAAKGAAAAVAVAAKPASAAIAKPAGRKLLH